MGTQMQMARKGYSFRLTDCGKRDQKLVIKFINNKNYRHCVPKRWITDYLVEEVKDEG